MRYRPLSLYFSRQDSQFYARNPTVEFLVPRVCRMSRFASPACRTPQARREAKYTAQSQTMGNLNYLVPFISLIGFPDFLSVNHTIYQRSHTHVFQRCSVCRHHKLGLHMCDQFQSHVWTTLGTIMHTCLQFCNNPTIKFLLEFCKILFNGQLIFCFFIGINMIGYNEN